MASLQSPERTRQGRKQLEKGAPKKTQNQGQTVSTSRHDTEGTRQRRKLLERGGAKETRKNTWAKPAFYVAPFKRSQLAPFCRSVPPRFEHRLFLSATPHNGHSNSFSA